MNMEMNTVNVHEYPQDPNDLPHYRAAVMLAAANGARVEESCKWLHQAHEWDFRFNPSWNWYEVRYRIAAPKIAKGHNPHNVTDDQLGIKAGWRLLEGAEIGRHRTEATQEIQAWGGDQWLTCPYCGADEDQTYRTKKPEGYFLPQPAVPLAELDDKALTGYIDSVPDGLAESLSSVLTQVWNSALKYERSRAK